MDNVNSAEVYHQYEYASISQSIKTCRKKCENYIFRIAMILKF